MYFLRTLITTSYYDLLLRPLHIVIIMIHIKGDNLYGPYNPNPNPNYTLTLIIC